MSTSLYRTSLVVVFGFLCAAAATADIYTWTDERGTTVIADKPPANPARVTDLELVVKEARKSARARSTGTREATPTEQKLLDRIDQLERQARAQTYTTPAPPPLAPAYSGNYYATTPPVPAYYDPSYYQSYGSYYPGYYPSYYPSSTVIAAPIIVRRGFVSRPIVSRGFVHHRRP